MAGSFQSSFIPKDPVVSEDVFKKKKAGPAGILAVSLFIFSIIVAGALFVYKGMLKGEIESVQSQLAAEEKKIDKEGIRELATFSKKLEIVKSIVLKHQVVSGFLDSLSSSTVSTVQITGLNFGAVTKEDMVVAMTGQTINYASVALQESIFSKNQFWRNVHFSELALADKGMVSFKASVAVDPQIVLYSIPVTPESVNASMLNGAPAAEDDADLNALNGLDSGDLDTLDAEINNL